MCDEEMEGKARLSRYNVHTCRCRAGIGMGTRLYGSKGGVVKGADKRDMALFKVSDFDPPSPSAQRHHMYQP